MPLLDLPPEEWKWMEEALLRVPEERRDARWRRCLDSVHLVLEAIRQAEENRTRTPRLPA